jgi:flavin reductase (DIM6/NTAB) family NADH-FMN oxidoreductase RutF
VTFRSVLSAVPTSVAVVTASTSDGYCGMTIGSLGSLSLDPPLVLFCVARQARSHPALCMAERYCISVLAEDQASVAGRFVGRDPERFRYGMFRMDGLPAVAGAAAWLLCGRHNLLTGGDHSIVIARVEWAERGSASPLLHVDRSFRSLTAAEPSTITRPNRQVVPRLGSVPAPARVSGPSG